ncbi:hypothetical protein GCM10009847_25810 [Leucobacter tardus]
MALPQTGDGIEIGLSGVQLITDAARVPVQHETCIGRTDPARQTCEQRLADFPLESSHLLGHRRWRVGERFGRT